MSAWNVSEGSWTGLSFTDPNSFYYKLNEFLTTPVASGGAGWYLIDDLTSGTAAPNYSFLPAAIDTVAETVNLPGHTFHTGQTVSIQSTSTLPSGMNAIMSVIVYDANYIQLATTYLNAITGVYANLVTQGSGTHSIYAFPKRCYCNVASPALNEQHKFLWVERGNTASTSTAAGYGYFRFPLWWNTATHRAYGIFSGCCFIITTISGTYTYSFRGNTNTIYLSVNNNYPLQSLAWYGAIYDDWVASTSFVESPSKIGSLVSGATAGNNVTLYLGTGQAVNFTVGNKYFIYDFGGHTWLNYVTVTARDTGLDTIVVDTIQKNFPSGSIIGAYPHRFYVGTLSVIPPPIIAPDNLTTNDWRCQIPYYSSSIEANAMHSQSGVIYTSAGMDAKIATIQATSTTSDGTTYYYCQRPNLYEAANASSTTVDMNRIYGSTQNLYLTTVMTSYTDKRTINGLNYKTFYYSTPQDPSWLIRDSTSIS